MADLPSLFQAIDRAVDTSSSRYGRLLNWQNFADPVWHYGIGLSDEYIFDTGLGICVFSRRDARPVLGIEEIAFPADITIARLKQALIVFQDWRYNLLAWNCEHLARLIATNQPRCYQSQPLWWLSGLTPAGDHPNAQQLLTEHLNRVGQSQLTRP
ncbi:hypothetical protein RIF25_03405 [Thermosynechococcaceae cyanobacterium BACA0444]|uniref:Uncharacterized protein n=1 Tax=Pseudocalidococcus azoricus BACA0444 TaxID=2918990 RepID=A0AAE4FPF5_9CYAN|nr:hypothetical protein [Pseudocalidococcus azoricus]MDS3859848.1 hypothetical protein [Pseudocalidococcus azoricus BACA0444]